MGDELTGNLDSKTSTQVMKVLSKVCRKQKITTIFVTHDESLVKYADRVIRLDSGLISSEEVGDAATQVKNMVNAVNDVADKVKDTVSGIASKAMKKAGIGN